MCLLPPFHFLLQLWFRFQNRLELLVPATIAFSFIVAVTAPVFAFRVRPAATFSFLVAVVAPVSAFQVMPAVAFSFKNPKATALKCLRKDSLIICATPLLTVALPSLDEDVKLTRIYSPHTVHRYCLHCDSSSWKNLCQIRVAFQV